MTRFSIILKKVLIVKLIMDGWKKLRSPVSYWIFLGVQTVFASLATIEALSLKWLMSIFKAKRDSAINCSRADYSS